MCQIVSSHIFMMLRICRRTDVMYLCVKSSICILTLYAYFNVWLCNTKQIIETSIANFPFMTTRPPAIVHHPPKHHLCPMFQNALTTFFWHFVKFANIIISMSGAAKKIKSLFKSSIPVRRDDMWDRMEFGFPEKNSPRLHRAPILWMNKIYFHNGLSELSSLLIEFSIFDTKWQEFNWKFGQYL